MIPFLLVFLTGLHALRQSATLQLRDGVCFCQLALLPHAPAHSAVSCIMGHHTFGIVG